MLTTSELELKLVDSYLALLKNMSANMRLELIAKLSSSLKTKEADKKGVDYYNGIWSEEENAEDIIENIRKSRVFNRQIENF